MLSEDKQNLIRKRLLEGATIEEVAKEVRCSERTVLRYKSKIPANVFAETPTGENDDRIVYTDKLYTYYEKKYTSFVEKEKIPEYEDMEEGWVYHLDKEDANLKTRGLWWIAIAYPESVKKGWIEKLEATGLGIKISPLHDKDKWSHDSPETVNKDTGELIPRGGRYKAGDKKKPHWHIIITCDKSVTAKEINTLIRGITNGPYLQKCRSLTHANKYLCHKTDHCKRQGKYQYWEEECIILNDFHVIPNKYEAAVLQCEISETIREKGWTSFTQLTDYYLNMPEMMMIIWAKPGFATNLIRAQWREQHPESRVQFTKELTWNEYNEFFRKEEE